MKVIAIQTSPNEDGLTHSLAQAALRGAQTAGAETEFVSLNDLTIDACEACGRGWGLCREQGRCKQDDDFNALRERINDADALVFATPVYFGDLSESAKCLLDRWRRCEVHDREHSALKGKRVIGIASAGGSGGGSISALGSLEKYLTWLQLTVWDLMPVTQRNKTWKTKALEEAGRNMVEAE